MFILTLAKNWLTFTILAPILVWACLWAIVGPSYTLPPHGSLFALALLYVVAVIGGQISAKLGLPRLLGMLIAGFILSNTFTTINLNRNLSSILRSFSLVIILLRAGLGLDPQVIKKRSAVIVRVAFIPLLVEGAIVTVTSHFLLGFPWTWALLLGFVLGAVTPAVVVPLMLSLQEKQLGVDKGIPTLLIAASSIDDVMSITGFGIMLSVVFDTGGSSLGWIIAKGPVEVIIGLLYGIAVGGLLWYLPISTSPPPTNITTKQNLMRLALLILVGTFAIYGGKSVNINGAGAYACLTVAFVSALRWRNYQLDEPIEEALKIIWSICQPFLFSLIGAEVKLESLGGNVIWLSILSLVVGLVIRIATAAAVVWGAKLNLKERLFVALGRLPKATVQAAIGPIALDIARQKADNSQEIHLATLVLTIAVLSVIITAPIGAIAIAVAGPRLLNRNVPKIAAKDNVTNGAKNDIDTLLPTTVHKDSQNQNNKVNN
jgi:NhaP-type Na+/H+ or K+/H+ antiporter